MIQSWPNSKDPADEADYSIDWIRLIGNDEISSSTWDIPDGVESANPDFSGSRSTIWISGGTAGEDYILTNRIVTEGGRTLELSGKLRVREK
jgi:hypothetical protein